MADTSNMLAMIGIISVLPRFMASLGLYGVISYSVRHRTREIDVRVAFGAENCDVVRLVIAQGVVIAGSGILLRLVASFPLSRAVRSFLVGVSPTDPVTFIGIPLLLLAVAALASYLPARRAATVDPVEALRDE